MKDVTEHWLNLAEYDLETARAMLKAGRYLYVTFMCHLTIEKTLTGGTPAAHSSAAAPGGTGGRH